MLWITSSPSLNNFILQSDGFGIRNGHTNKICSNAMFWMTSEFVCVCTLKFWDHSYYIGSPQLLGISLSVIWQFWPIMQIVSCKSTNSVTFLQPTSFFSCHSWLWSLVWSILIMLVSKLRKTRKFSSPLLVWCSSHMQINSLEKLYVLRFGKIIAKKNNHLILFMSYVLLGKASLFWLSWLAEIREQRAFGENETPLK